VIAGYNAGPDAVERWLAKSPTPMEPDEFAEDIGYTETRRYVKRVLGYVQVWRQVHGDG
jgi:soluble lytic murein transglycosylase